MRDILEGPGAAALPLEDGYIGTFDLWASETAIVGRKGIGIHAKFKFRLSRPPGSQCLVFSCLLVRLRALTSTRAGPPVLD